jgi:hypothetical protein
MKTKLTKWELLFIRECKAGGRDIERFRRLFAKRCWLDLTYVNTTDVVYFTLSIVSKLELSEVEDMFDTVVQNGRYYSKMGIDNEMVDKVMSFAVSKLRLWHPCEGYPVPPHFRNKENKVDNGDYINII